MTFTARQMAQSAIKSMHQSQTMEVKLLFIINQFDLPNHMILTPMVSVLRDVHRLLW